MSRSILIAVSAAIVALFFEFGSPRAAVAGLMQSSELNLFAQTDPFFRDTDLVSQSGTIGPLHALVLAQVSVANGTVTAGGVSDAVWFTPSSGQVVIDLFGEKTSPDIYGAFTVRGSFPGTLSDMWEHTFTTDIDGFYTLDYSVSGGITIPPHIAPRNPLRFAVFFQREGFAFTFVDFIREEDPVGTLKIPIRADVPTTVWITGGFSDGFSNGSFRYDWGGTFDWSFDTSEPQSAVPEPDSAVLILTGAIGLCGFVRRKQSRHS